MASATLIPAKATFYKPELDSLRFFAFLGVFLFHPLSRTQEFYSAYSIPAGVISAISGALAAGACGVDLFFALSAYLITSLLMRERETAGKLNVRNFYIRRILRIWPLYFAFILLAFVLGLVVKSQSSFRWEYVAGFALLSGNWVFVLHGLPLRSIALPLWSVSIEEQFYLAWPLIVRKASLKVMVSISILLLLAANLTRIVLASGGFSQASLEYNTLTRLDPIAMGILLALGEHGGYNLARRTTLQRLALLFASVGMALAVGIYCGLYPLDGVTVNRCGTIIGRPVMAFASVSMLSAVLGLGRPGLPALL